MKRSALIILAAAGAIALAAWRLAPADGHGNPARTTTPAASAGYVVHVDQNGTIVEETTPQAQAEFNAELSRAISTSQEGLVVKASPVAGGGTMIDLQGRFQSAVVATRDANGTINAPCLTNEGDVRAFTSATAADAAANKK